MSIKCPICNNKYKNLGTHFKKTKCIKHQNYKKQHLNEVLKEFKSGTNICNIQTFVSYKELTEFLKENSDYHNIINNNNSIRSKKVQKGIIRNKTKEIKEEAIKLFSTALSISKITKKLNIHEKTLKKVWKEEFGQDKINKRTNRLKNLYLKLNNNRYSIIKNNEIHNIVVPLFYSNEPVKSVAKKANISSVSVITIWKKVFGECSYNKRKIRMIKIQQKNSKKCSKIGSKNEILCYKLLKSIYSTTIHHDYSLVKNLEIDISIPDKKVAINWDGIVHRKPIYGEKVLSNIIRKDNIKSATLKKNNWTNIVIIDNGSYNPDFVFKKVNEILDIINSKITGKIEI